jgi:tetratricopeptide (TPR) repeat protein
MATDVLGFHLQQDLYVDVERRIIFRNGNPLARLTRLPFDILEFYLRNANVLIKRSDVGPLKGEIRAGRPVDHYVTIINRKLGWKKGEVFVVTRGIGFTLQANVRAFYSRDREKGIEILKISEFNSNIHTIEKLKSSLEQSLEVVESNPHGLPDAYIRAAYNYLNLGMAAYSVDLPCAVMPKARDKASKVLDHPLTCSKAQGVLGLVSMIYDYDWEEAEKHFLAAMKSNPDEPRTLLYYAHFSITSGRFHEGISAVERAAHIAPADPIIYSSWGWITFLAGNTEEGIRLGLQALSRHPKFAPAHNMLGWAYEADGQYDLALRHYEQSLMADFHPAALWSLGHLYGKVGQRLKALEALTEWTLLKERGVIKYISSYGRALIHAGLQEIEPCLIELGRAYEERCDWLMHLVLERRWDPVRQTRAFIDLVAKVGMPYRGSPLQPMSPVASSSHS